MFIVVGFSAPLVLSFHIHLFAYNFSLDLF